MYVCNSKNTCKIVKINIIFFLHVTNTAVIQHHNSKYKSKETIYSIISVSLSCFFMFKFIYFHIHFWYTWLNKK